MSSPEPPRELADIPGLTAARAADTLDRLGERNRVCAPVLRAVRRGMRLVGPAVTVSFEPDDGRQHDDPYGAMIAVIDGLGPGDVLVIAAGGDERSAYWGQLFSAAAHGHGAVGVVCDGPVRDTAEIATGELAVFGVGRRPVDYRARMQITSVAEPVTCAGVTVAPGDIVIADDDGVVVVPASLADEVAALVVTRATTEDVVLQELLAGASLRQVWDRHRVL